MGGLLLWYSEEGPGRGRSPPSALLAVTNVTAHSEIGVVSLSVSESVRLAGTPVYHVALYMKYLHPRKG